MAPRTTAAGPKARVPTDTSEFDMAPPKTPEEVRRWLKGRTIDQAEQIKNTQIVEELSLPPVKIHCSVLAEDAIRAAITDYKQKNGLALPAQQQPASL